MQHPLRGPPSFFKPFREIYQIPATKVKEGKTELSQTRQGDGRARDSDLPEKKTVSKKKGRNVSDNADTLCLSERCPVGLSTTMTRSNPCPDGNVQAFRLCFVHNSTDDTVCCSATGDRRTMKSPDACRIPKLSPVNS